MDANKLAQEFIDLYNGHPWLEVTLLGSLANVTADEAAAHPVAGCHSVWELVNHLAQWRANVLRRVRGEVIVTPVHNYFEPVSDRSETAWRRSLEALEATQADWVGALQAGGPDPDTVYPNNGFTNYQHIQGVLLHDAYHLGQIVLLLKVARSTVS